jgi:hypothetical protein
MTCRIVFTMLAEPNRFASSVVTLQGYKAGVVTPLNLHVPTQSPTIPPPPSLWLKRKRK